MHNPNNKKDLFYLVTEKKENSLICFIVIIIHVRGLVVLKLFNIIIVSIEFLCFKENKMLRLFTGSTYDKTKEFVFAGISMFWERLSVGMADVFFSAPTI